MQITQKIKIIKHLQTKKYRITKTRLNIINILCKHENLTLKKIVSELNKKQSIINISTIYNTINFLLLENLIQKYTLDNKNILYRINSNELLSHLYCQSCKTYTKIMKSYPFKLENNHNFKIKLVKVEYIGVCSSCLEKLNIN